MLVLDTKNSRLLDEIAVKNGISIHDLIFSSAQQIANYLSNEGCAKKSILFICGKGYNGADAIAAAIILHEKGIDVTLYISSFLQNKLSRETLYFFNTALKKNIKVSQQFVDADIYIDALFGTGFSGSIDGEYKEIIQQINSARGNSKGKKVISIDIPSGLNGDTGVVKGEAVIADETLSLASLKKSFYLNNGPDYCGKITLLDIGLPSYIYEQVEASANVISIENAGRLLPKRSINSYKGSSGYLVILAGSIGMMGAVVNAASSAYNVGAGLVKIGVPEEIINYLNIAFHDAIYFSFPNKKANEILSVTLNETKEYDAIIIGPGLKLNEENEQFICDVIQQIDMPMIIDASALGAVSRNNPKSILSSRKSKTILTPHPGEMANLLGISVSECEENRLETAKAAAEIFNSIIVYKGGRAIIACPDGTVYFNSTGNSSLAVAGTGDMLAGIIGGFLCSGMKADDAAIIGSYVGGLASEEYTKKNNILSSTATELIKYIPTALDDIVNSLAIRFPF